MVCSNTLVFDNIVIMLCSLGEPSHSFNIIIHSKHKGVGISPAALGLRCIQVMSGASKFFKDALAMCFVWRGFTS